MKEILNDNSRIAKNTLYLYIRMIIVLFASLYTTRIVLRSLGVIDYGIKNVVSGFVLMFSFINTSMSNGIQRFYNFELGQENTEKIKEIYTTALIIQCIISLIIILILETIGIWYINNKMIIPIERLKIAKFNYHLSILSLVFVIMQIPYSAAIMAYEQMNYYSFVSIIEVFLNLIFATLLPHANYDKLLCYGLYSLAVKIINFLLYYLYCRYNFKELKIHYKYNKELFIKMLTFSGWNVFGTFSYMIKNQGINLLLNTFFGPTVNAARGISSMVNSAIQGFSGNIVIAFRPQLVQAYANNNYFRVKILMYSLSKISYIMLLILSIPVILEIKYILILWLGNIIPDYTISFTIIILIIMLVSSLNIPLSQVIHATGKMKNYQIGTSTILILILPFSWLFLHLGYNPLSVFIISLIFVIINLIASLYLTNKVFSFDLYEYIEKVILPCFLITIWGLIFPLFIKLFLDSSLIRLILILLSTIISIIPFTYILILDKNEKELINNLIKSKIKQYL